MFILGCLYIVRSHTSEQKLIELNYEEFTRTMPKTNHIPKVDTWDKDLNTWDNVFRSPPNYTANILPKPSCEKRDDILHDQKFS